MILTNNEIGLIFAIPFIFLGIAFFIDYLRLLKREKADSEEYERYLYLKDQAYQWYMDAGGPDALVRKLEEVERELDSPSSSGVSS